MSREPNWQPISALPLIGQLIDGTLQGIEENLASLSEARTRPHALDDVTVKRFVKVYTEQGENLSLYGEQLSRWQKDKLTESESAEVERLFRQLARLREVNSSILSLAGELGQGTIEKVLAKDDLELGLCGTPWKENTLSDNPPKTHAVRLPDGRIGNMPTADFERLKIFASTEQLTVEEWLRKHAVALVPVEGGGETAMTFANAKTRTVFAPRPRLRGRARRR